MRPGSEIPVCFLLLPGYLLTELGSAAEALRIAGNFGARFALRYVGPVPDPVNSIGLALGGVEPLPDALPDDSWVVVLGQSSSVAQDPAAMAQARKWLAKVCGPRVLLVTICSGALLAASAGLLDGRRCTTHHTLVEQLRALAPKARVEENRVFVVDGQVASSAGITTGVDLMLELIAAAAGPKVALDVAREMVVWLRRDGESPQISPFLTYRNHLHPAVHRVQDAIAANPTRDWPVDELARIACVTPRHLARLFRDNAGVTPIDYRRQLQLAVVDELISRRDLSMERIAEASGFGSARDMRRVWLKQRGTGLQRA